MPRAFSELERESVRKRLYQAALASFSALGVHRTAVEDLTRAAGISKGAFYVFYDSKEALLLDILECLEADFQSRLLQLVLRPGISPRQSLRELLRETLAVRSANPLLRRLSVAEFEHFFRGLPPQRAEEVRQADLTTADRFLEYWRRRGVLLPIDAELLTGLLRALELASRNEPELGAAAHARAVDWLVEAVAASLVPGRP